MVWYQEFFSNSESSVEGRKNKIALFTRCFVARVIPLSRLGISEAMTPSTRNLEAQEGAYQTPVLSKEADALL